MSQETKDIQASLHTSLSGLALNKDIKILDETSSATSRQSTPTLFQDPQGIPLRIKDWARRAREQPQSPEDGRMRAIKIFQLFIEIGTVFGLKETPCIKILENAVDICNNQVTSKSLKVDKIADQTRSKTPSLTMTLKNFVLERIPVYNIFEAMCWVYTCCVATDKIRKDCDAERYLYQLRLIFKALKATKWVQQTPTTVAATWNAPSNNDPLIVAFACSCVGKQNLKSEIAAARREYVRGLHSHVQNFTYTSNAPNIAGNCPEFVVWGTVCKARNSYRSLCLHMNKEMSYKYCGHCEFLAKAASEGNSIRIEDWYDKSCLVVPELYKKNKYDGCMLKDIQIIVEEGSHQKIGEKVVKVSK